MSIGNHVFFLVMRDGSGTRVEDVEFHARKTKDIFKSLYFCQMEKIFLSYI